jgi:hypothetical protein
VLYLYHCFLLFVHCPLLATMILVLYYVIVFISFLEPILLNSHFIFFIMIMFMLGFLAANAFPNKQTKGMAGMRFSTKSLTSGKERCKKLCVCVCLDNTIIILIIIIFIIYLFYFILIINIDWYEIPRIFTLHRSRQILIDYIYE